MNGNPKIIYLVNINSQKIPAKMLKKKVYLVIQKKKQTMPSNIILEEESSLSINLFLDAYCWLLFWIHFIGRILQKVLRVLLLNPTESFGWKTGIWYISCEAPVSFTCSMKHLVYHVVMFVANYLQKYCPVGFSP